MCCWFDIVRLTGRERGQGGSRSGGGGGSVKLTHHERWWGLDEMGMRGHHIFLLRHIMTAEKRVMAVAVVMAMA